MCRYQTSDSRVLGSYPNTKTILPLWRATALIVCRTTELVRLSRTRGRRQTVSFDDRPFLASMSASRAKNFVLAGAVCHLSRPLDIAHKTSPEKETWKYALIWLCCQ